jgi:hypothetical protein
MLNENFWGMDFKGFRFPYTDPGYWSLIALDEHDYIYESSIGADNLNFFHGSIFPYNLVVTRDGYYRCTEILEIAPTYHDDYYFLNAIKKDQSPGANQLEKSIEVYSNYLDNFWNYAVKPYHGLMVYLGHPEFVGYNDSTMVALKRLIKDVKKDNTWLTTLNEVADFRKSLGMLQFFVDIEKNRQRIDVIAPGTITVKDVCLNFTGKIKSASAKKGKVRVIKNSQGSQLVFDAFNGQALTIQSD